MLKEQVQTMLERDPFVPLRIHLQDGRKFDVSHRDAARFLGYGVLVFIGLEEGSRQAKGYDRFPFERIERIEELPAGGRPRRSRTPSGQCVASRWRSKGSVWWSAASRAHSEHP